MDLSVATLFMALAIGFASGSIGAFIILKRMALVGDALSHVALPGIGLALIYGFDPFWGVLVFLLGAAFLVWWLEGKTKLPSDAIVGLLFTASLAIGIIVIPDHEIIESLFGSFPDLPFSIFVFLLLLAVFLTMAVFFLIKKFLFAVAAPELARIEDPLRKWDLVLLLIFSLIVALGIKLVGTLLMGALTIIPAAIAKNISRGMTEYLVLSTALGGIISLAGAVFSQGLGFLPGPTIILLGILLFLPTLFWSRK